MAPNLNISYTYLLFIQTYALFLYHLYWLSDLEFGRKGREHLRKRKPFDEEVATKLSDYFLSGEYIDWPGHRLIAFIRYLNQSWRK